MEGNKEFLILFIPFLAIALGLTYINLTNSFGWIIEGLLWLFAVFCYAVNIFALLVQYINWKYYKEE
jgi:hypothetical protein